VSGRIAFAAIAWFAGLIGSAEAGAALINPVSQIRTVSASVESPGPDPVSDSDSDSAANFGTFHSSVTAQVDLPGGSISNRATQSSSIGSEHVSASGQVATTSSYFPPGSSGGAVSTFQLTFEVLQPVEFELTWYLEGVDINPCLCALAEASLRGGPGDQTIFAWFEVDDFFSDTEYGVLAPGQYTLLARAQLSHDAPVSASYQIDLGVVLVPEPSTALLLAGGLLALALRRRPRIG
jgi:hypothetical protein